MIFDRFFSDTEKKTAAKLSPIVARINGFEEEMQTLSDSELAAKTDHFKKKYRNGSSLDELLPEAFATVREAAKRTLGQRHYDVQLMGGIVLHQGTIAEMKTGEGKTLAATLPAYLNALSEESVHVVTVNDYLARRDATWMGQIYHSLGMSVGVLNSQASFLYDQSYSDGKEGRIYDDTRDELGSFKVVHEFLRPCSKKEAYDADITYGTNSEFGFDYLRDNVSYKKEDLSQRAHTYAIVDEIDSILIDEARTPLIISAPSEDPESLYYTFSKIAAAMQKDTDFAVDEKLRAVELRDEGITKAEKMLGIDNIYTEKGVKYVHHLENAVRAKALFERDKEYVVRDGAIVIVDEFTGRLQPGRRWSEGLHQAIEAKEGVKVQRESRTVASVTYQNYFRHYVKLSGMTGTALTSAEEFQKVYNLLVLPVPTHRPMVRKDYNDLIFQTEKGKFAAVATHIKELNKRGQPVLVGTVSIEKNELLSAYLTKEGVPHEILNAKNHEREGEIIAQAGRLGQVTIATNMAGRGVDIILGGNPPHEDDAKKVRDLGGLYVLGTERHEARRIDNQLRGRAGRQGDPGASQFFVSLEDTLMRVFASDTIKNMMGRFGIPEDQPIENRLITRSLENAQTKIEGFHFDSRKHILAFDDVLNKHRKSVYELRRDILLGEHEKAKEFLDKVVGFDPPLGKIVEEKKEKLGDEVFFQTFGIVVLRAVDIHWMEHLETMEYLRSSVNLRAYGQRDPLVEYKKEGLRLYKEMRESLLHHVAEIIPKIGDEIKLRSDTSAREDTRNVNLLQKSANLRQPAAIPFPRNQVSDQSKTAPAEISKNQKVGRNDSCPCGSGKKYKKCHG